MINLQEAMALNWDIAHSLHITIRLIAARLQPFSTVVTVVVDTNLLLNFHREVNTQTVDSFTTLLDIICFKQCMVLT